MIRFLYNYKFLSRLVTIIMYRILCIENVSDEDMLEKTYTTFHASNMLLQ